MTKGGSVQLAGSLSIRGQEPGRPDFGVLPDPSFGKPQVYKPHVSCRLDPWVGEDLLEEEMVNHSSILASRIPWTQELVEL